MQILKVYKRIQNIKIQQSNKYVHMKYKLNFKTLNLKFPILYHKKTTALNMKFMKENCFESFNYSQLILQILSTLYHERQHISHKY